MNKTDTRVQTSENVEKHPGVEFAGVGVVANKNNSTRGWQLINLSIALNNVVARKIEWTKQK